MHTYSKGSLARISFIYKAFLSLHDDFRGHKQEILPQRVQPRPETDKPYLQSPQTKSNGYHLHASHPGISACELYQAKNRKMLWPCIGILHFQLVGRARGTHMHYH
ncbi:hypothetical protein PanWU01x14_271980 [Parasponia andersonii]|uniref:Uncharacterized protein n=1 Tax=Parasponia andersonii TaxID=3476 RepID=A0A2P5B4C7_PARAD|nr:hypothetical protein PanWU01x14_271980 [Parasponia andersonii]